MGSYPVPSKTSVAGVGNISFEDKIQKDSGAIIPDPYNSKNYFREGTELVVFPESVIWGTLDRNKTFGEWAKKTIKEQNLYLIMGQILWDDEENYRTTE